MSRQQSFFRRHSLSIASVAILLLWIWLYNVSSPSTHLGSFFGNAIADWTGVAVMVLATKYLNERGSAESRRPPQSDVSPGRKLRRAHPLSIFLLLPGIGGVR